MCVEALLCVCGLQWGLMTAVSKWILHARCLTDHKAGGKGWGQARGGGQWSWCFFTLNMMLFIYFKRRGVFANWFCFSVYFHAEWSESSVFLADSPRCFQLICSIHEQVLTFPCLKHCGEYSFFKNSPHRSCTKGILSLESALSHQRSTQKSHQGWNLWRYFTPVDLRISKSLNSF